MTLTPRELKRLHHAGAAPAHAVWKTAMRAATSMMLELVAEFGIAPNSPRLQRGANLSQLFSLWGKWSLHEVTLLGLSIISRWLCF